MKKHVNDIYSLVESNNKFSAEDIRRLADELYTLSEIVERKEENESLENEDPVIEISKENFYSALSSVNKQYS